LVTSITKHVCLEWWPLMCLFATLQGSRRWRLDQHMPVLPAPLPIMMMIMISITKQRACGLRIDWSHTVARYHIRYHMCPHTLRVSKRWNGKYVSNILIYIYWTDTPCLLPTCLWHRRFYHEENTTSSWVPLWGGGRISLVDDDETSLVNSLLEEVDIGCGIKNLPDVV
jgi:hypothetical protein